MNSETLGLANRTGESRCAASSPSYLLISRIPKDSVVLVLYSDSPSQTFGMQNSKFRDSQEGCAWTRRAVYVIAYWVI
jgi:hypothetical protein